MSQLAPWLPERLPADWDVVQMRRFATFRNGADYKDVEVAEGGYPVYGSGGEFRRASDYLYDGDSVLFGRKGTVNRPLLVSGRFWTVDTMFFTDLSSDIEPRFLHYYATTMPFDYYSTNTALPSMTQGDLGGHRMPLAPLDEQRAIADYLDRETARIDTLIEEQGRLIEYARERRSALISAAVTGQIDVLRGALSGNEYRYAPVGGVLKKLPAQWELGRIKWDTHMSAGATPSTDNAAFWLDSDDPDGLPFVAIADMSRRSHVTRTSKSVSKAALASRSMPKGTPGTLLFAMYASVGEVAFLELEATWNQALLGITPFQDRVDSRFLRYTLLDMRDDLLRDVRSTTQDNLNAGQVGNIWFQRPPMEEQRRIADYLDEQTAKIDALIAETETFIELSRERRSALITAAVTGQIDVREVA